MSTKCPVVNDFKSNKIVVNGLAWNFPTVTWTVPVVVRTPEYIYMSRVRVRRIAVRRRARNEIHTPTRVRFDQIAIII